MPRRHPSLSVREATAHAVILGGVLWIGAVLLVATSTAGRDRFGTLVGADFVHFYTLGRIALDGQPERLYDGAAQHRRQVELVPMSARDSFIPVYPPQTALWFAPFALMPYPAGAALWALFTMAVYGLAVSTAWRATGGALDGRLVAAAAIGCPAFVSLILHGQTTAIPMLAFTLGYLALARGQAVLAGAVLALALVKPQLGLVLAAVVVAGAEWKMLAGAVGSALLQAGAVAVALGPEALGAYVGVLRELPSITSLLEPKPYQLHSMRAVTALLPDPAGSIVWLLAAAAVTTVAVRVWRRGGSLAMRFGLLLLASVLVSPHLTVYDATLVAPAVIWIAGDLVRLDAPRAMTVGRLVYLLFPLLLVPTALFMRVQASVAVLAVMFAVASRAALAAQRDAGGAALRMKTTQRSSA